MDEAIFLFIKNAWRLRCGFHLVQKMWEKHIGKDDLSHPEAPSRMKGA